MKKLLSVLLTLSMLLTLLIVPISATGETIGADLASVTKATITDANSDGVDDVTGYYIIDSADDLIAGYTEAGTYILAGNIDFAEKGTITQPFFDIAGDFTIEGNGYSLTNIAINWSADNYALIRGKSSSSNKYTVTVQNLGVTATATLRKQSAILLAYQTYNTYNIQNVLIDADITQNGQSVACFLGYNYTGNKATFINCTAKGNWNFDYDGVQAGGFIGHNRNEATFSYCSIDANITSSNNRKGGYIGQNNAVKATFNNCSATGIMIEKSLTNSSSEEATKWLSPYISGVYGASNVSFTDCTSSATVYGVRLNGGFIGGTDNKDTTILSFNNADYNGLIMCAGGVGALIGQENTKITETVTDCDNTGKLYGASIVNIGEIDDTQTAVLQVLDDSVQTGAMAYALATIQKANGVDSKYLYGHNLGTDINPTPGAKTVYKIATSRGESQYSNVYTGVDTLVPGNAAYFQTANGSDETHKNVRVLLAIKETDITDAKNLEFKVVFTLKDSTQKTLTVTDASEAIANYYAVYAGDRVVETSNGYVMLAVVVEDVDTTAMELTAANLAVYLKVGENMIYNNDPTIDAPEYAD